MTEYEVYDLPWKHDLLDTEVNISKNQRKKWNDELFKARQAATSSINFYQNGSKYGKLKDIAEEPKRIILLKSPEASHQKLTDLLSICSKWNAKHNCHIYICFTVKFLSPAHAKLLAKLEDDAFSKVFKRIYVIYKDNHDIRSTITYEISETCKELYILSNNDFNNEIEVVPSINIVYVKIVKEDIKDLNYDNMYSLYTASLDNFETLLLNKSMNDPAMCSKIEYDSKDNDLDFSMFGKEGDMLKEMIGKDGKVKDLNEVMRMIKGKSQSQIIEEANSMLKKARKPKRKIIRA